MVHGICQTILVFLHGGCNVLGAAPQTPFSLFFCRLRRRKKSEKNILGDAQRAPGPPQPPPRATLQPPWVFLKAPHRGLVSAASAAADPCALFLGRLFCPCGHARCCALRFRSAHYKKSPPRAWMRYHPLRGFHRGGAWLRVGRAAEYTFCPPLIACQERAKEVRCIRN